MTDERKNGIERIAAERRHQIALGWDRVHDDEHEQSELVRAAIMYAIQGLPNRCCGLADLYWPWDNDGKGLMASDPSECLAKAGALLAAEIERLERRRGVLKIRDEEGVRHLIADLLTQGATCPLCGSTHPHDHTALEIVCYRNGIKWARLSEIDNAAVLQAALKWAEADTGDIAERQRARVDLHAAIEKWRGVLNDGALQT